MTHVRNMPRSTSCTGCGKIFSSSKYRRSHLSQTTNPLCQSERQAFLARHLPGYSPPTSPWRSTPPLASSPLQSHTSIQLSPETPFEHPPDTPRQEPFDFDGGDGFNDDDDDTSNDDSEEDPEDPSGEHNCDDEHGRFLSAEEVTNLQGEIWGELHVEAYPGRYAGIVHSEGISTMKEFDNTLGGPSSNPYSPFNSQTDWELAKWAKLRGPGSTAFTELMGVTGVCPPHFSKFLANDKNSCAKS